MSALVVRIDARGLAEVEAKLGRLNPLQAGDLLLGLARLIREQTRDRLISGGPAPDGTAWRPNVEGRTPILHRSGALARSIDYLVSGSSLVVGSGLVYAAIHQYGGPIRAKTGQALRFRIGGALLFRRSVEIPKRPYLGLSDTDRAEVVDATVRYIRKVLG